MEQVHGKGQVHGMGQAHDTLAHGGMALDDKAQVHDKLAHGMMVVGEDKELVHGDRDREDGEQAHGAEGYGHLQVHVVPRHGSLVHVPPQKILNRLILQGGGQSKPIKRNAYYPLPVFYKLTIRYFDHMLLVWWPL